MEQMIKDLFKKPKNKNDGSTNELMKPFAGEL